MKIQMPNKKDKVKRTYVVTKDELEQKEFKKNTMPPLISSSSI